MEPTRHDPLAAPAADVTADGEFARFRAVKRFGSLDGLRCLAILMVIWNHLPAVDPQPFTPALNKYFGVMGVDLFFVISGMLITTLLLRERDSTGTISLGKFYARRSLRIFPLYYLVLGVFTALVLVMERRPAVAPETGAAAGWAYNGAARAFFHNLPAFVTYTANWFVDLLPNSDGQRRVIFVFAWSLATEEQFYFFWPASLKRLRPYGGAALMLGLIAIDQAAQFGSFDSLLSARALKIVRSIATPICFGSLLAILIHHRRGFAAAQVLAGRWWSSLLWFGSAAALMAWWSPRTVDADDARFLGDDPGNPVYRLVFQGVFAMIVLSCVMRERHAMAPALRFAPVRRFGEISYGVYMLHMLSAHSVVVILTRLHVEPEGWARFLGTVAFVYGAAEVSFRTYERFFLNLKHRFEVRHGKS